MAARAKKRAAYGLLALTVAVVGSSAPQSAETVSLLAAARTDGSARYLPRQKGQLHLGRAQIVNLHGCETRLRTTPMGAGRARIHLLSPFFGMKAVDVRNYMLEHFGTLKAYVNCDVTLDPRWTAVTRMQGPELPLTDEHAWQSSPLPFPETAEDPLRSKCGTRLLRAGHIGARN